MFAFPQPAIPQPLPRPFGQFGTTLAYSMSDQNTPLSPENRGHSGTNQLDSTPFTFSLSSPPHPGSTRTSNSRFAQRYASSIARPAARVAERQSRESRRDSFLNKVKRSRQSDKFEARSDQIQRSDFLEQRKRFEEEMAKSGPQLDNIEEDEGDDYVDAYPQEEDKDIDESLLEDFIAQEENEYMTLAEDMPDTCAAEEPLNSDILYGDMEEDGLLVDLIDQIESQSHQQMDMSGT
ncbi:conserved hypothetical protein [Trichophyton verrucosum HKI 0517]|uniref:Uncharacterized protein n=1 Tax=Trichophyton verrucosum (strain HKI 0517) TaxID=663202 RepID=D4DK93_TRIVH|nr:uncharacterized protein TRV_07614 [Trichophyton verrucosum HKI 0517]EFE37733.1 conserved hypothetical protein [Trichophyton verrucosum HKI 0517]